MSKKSKILVYSLIIIIVVGVLIGGGFYIFKKQHKMKVISIKEASEKAVNYINKDLLQGRTTVTLKNAEEESGVYKISLDIRGRKYDSYVSKDGKLFFPQAFDLNSNLSTTGQKPKNQNKKFTIDNFLVSKDKICRENGKPIIYFFGSKSCPHCRWEHPIVEDILKKFKNYVSFHNNMDSNADSNIFSKYNSEGGIPTLVLGCRYYRVGSGERQGKDKETKDLTALICKLTNGQPANVCAEVKNLTDKIKD